MYRLFDNFAILLRHTFALSAANKGNVLEVENRSKYKQIINRTTGKNDPDMPWFGSLDPDQH